MQRAADKLERACENDKSLRELQKELRQTVREWQALFATHITEYREAALLAQIQYSKQRAINAGGQTPLQTTSLSSEAIAEAHRPTKKRQRTKKIAI